MPGQALDHGLDGAVEKRGERDHCEGEEGDLHELRGVVTGDGGVEPANHAACQGDDDGLDDRQSCQRNENANGFASCAPSFLAVLVPIIVPFFLFTVKLIWELRSSSHQSIDFRIRIRVAIDIFSFDDQFPHVSVPLSLGFVMKPHLIQQT